MKIAVVLGTRPEIIKLASVIQELQKEKINFFIIHTNQHYYPLMDKIFFKELHLPNYKYGLDIGSATHGRQTGKMMISIEDVVQNEKVTHIIVQGDTNTTLAAALAGSKILNIKICHVEAGLRSYDRKMPEEINRVITDHLSDYCFCPTMNQKKILIEEGINTENIFVTGNTIVDAVYNYLPEATKNSTILLKLKLNPKKYILFTLHRPVNVDQKDKLLEIFIAIAEFACYVKLPVIFPVHPRTFKQLEISKIKIPKEIKIIKPLGFFDFLILEKNAKLILTDSGGVQEEACILKVPCVTLRENTERPETIAIGANIVEGVSKESIIGASKIMFEKNPDWSNPFGDGSAAKKIISIIKRNR